MASTSAANTQHLRTDHLVQNLAQHAVSGGLIIGAAQGAKFVLNLTSAVVLARLLDPEDFGLLGMALAVTSLLGLFKEAGLSTATVQRETITQEQVSNLFWINLALSGIIGIVSIALAPLAAWFYRDPRLASIMLALSFTFLLTGSTVQHQALLRRQMRFRAIATIEIVSITTGIVMASCLALLGLAYWSLVGQQLCVAAIGLGLTWWTSGWRPTMPTRRSGVAPLLRFGAHLTASDLLGRFAATSDRILIGRFFGAGPLGLYSRASVLLERPLEELLSPLGAVLIPVLSRLQSDPQRYRRTFMRAYDTMALIIFPFAALCLALSEPLVLLLLGSKWRGAVPLFAGFTLVALSLPPSILASWLFISQGRGRDLLKTYSVLSFVTVSAFIVGLLWGPLGVVLSLATVSLLIRLPILYHLAGRRGPVHTADLWKSFLAHLPCWGAVYATTALAQGLVGDIAPLLQLLVCAPVGFVAAGAAILALERPRKTALCTWHTFRSSLPRQQGNTA